jgi:hypothetical protein
MAVPSSDFYIDADTEYGKTGEAIDKMRNPYVLDIVSKFAKILTPEQLEEMHQEFFNVFDIFGETTGDTSTIDNVPGGVEMLHMLINMKYFVNAFNQVHQVCASARSNIEKQSYNEALANYPTETHTDTPTTNAPSVGMESNDVQQSAKRSRVDE